MVKNPLSNAGDVETWVWSLSGEDPLKEEMATHSSLLAWKIPWTEHGPQSMGSQRVGHDWVSEHAERIKGRKKSKPFLSIGNEDVFLSIPDRLNEGTFELYTHLTNLLYVYRSHLNIFPWRLLDSLFKWWHFSDLGFYFFHFGITGETPWDILIWAISVLILSHPRHTADAPLNDLAFGSIFSRRKSKNSYIHS